MRVGAASILLEVLRGEKGCYGIVATSVLLLLVLLPFGSLLVVVISIFVYVLTMSSVVSFVSAFALTELVSQLNLLPVISVFLFCVAFSGRPAWLS